MNYEQRHEEIIRLMNMMLKGTGLKISQMQKMRGKPLEQYTQHELHEILIELTDEKQ